MQQSIRDLWWVPVTRGIASIVFGIMVLVWPAASVYTVAVIFASLLAVYGIMDIITGVQRLTDNFSGIMHLLLGLLEVGVVIYMFRNAGSGLTLAVMGLLMAVTLIFMAAIMTFGALLSDASGGYRWAVGIMGVITLFVGITVARAPVISISTVILVFGFFGLFTGPIEIASGLMLKNDDKA
jgi:uncharacterized membrane protein HdeD (DUF308 family)